MRFRFKFYFLVYWYPIVSAPLLKRLLFLHWTAFQPESKNPLGDLYNVRSIFFALRSTLSKYLLNNWMFCCRVTSSQNRSLCKFEHVDWMSDYFRILCIHTHTHTRVHAGFSFGKGFKSMYKSISSSLCDRIWTCFDK